MHILYAWFILKIRNTMTNTAFFHAGWGSAPSESCNSCSTQCKFSRLMDRQSKRKDACCACHKNPLIWLPFINFYWDKWKTRFYIMLYQKLWKNTNIVDAIKQMSRQPIEKVHESFRKKQLLYVYLRSLFRIKKMTYVMLSFFLLLFLKV